MMDTTAAHIEFTVSADGKKVWVNVNGKCAIRVYDPASITIEDQRLPSQEPEPC